MPDGLHRTCASCGGILDILCACESFCLFLEEEGVVGAPLGRPAGGPSVTEADAGLQGQPGSRHTVFGSVVR